MDARELAEWLEAHGWERERSLENTDPVVEVQRRAGQRVEHRRYERRENLMGGTYWIIAARGSVRVSKTVSRPAGARDEPASPT